MHRILFKQRSFTLMELLVVVTITGIIAAFAIPSYQKSVDKSYARQAILDLILISGAEEVYKARYGQYWPSDTTTKSIAFINQDLQLNLVANGQVLYQCQNAYECIAFHVWEPYWVYSIVPGVNPTCTGGTPCPL